MPSDPVSTTAILLVLAGLVILGLAAITGLTWIAMQSVNRPVGPQTPAQEAAPPQVSEDEEPCDCHEQAGNTQLRLVQRISMLQHLIAIRAGQVMRERHSIPSPQELRADTDWMLGVCVLGPKLTELARKHVNGECDPVEDRPLAV